MLPQRSWRGDPPLTGRHTADLCRGVVRSVEGAASGLLTADAGEAGDGSVAASDAVLSGGPAA